MRTNLDSYATSAHVFVFVLVVLSVKVHDSEINQICFYKWPLRCNFLEKLAYSVRGYHAYFKDTTVCFGEILFCETESDNSFDKYAVAVKTDNGELVGHVPIELSKIFTDFLKDYGDIEVECTDCRYNLGKGKRMEVPVDYKFIGNLKYLKKLKKKIDEALSICFKKNPEEGNSHRTFKLADCMSQRF